MALQLFSRSAEAKLMETLGKLHDTRAGWVGVHFHLSNLLEQYQSEYQVKIAINLIHDLLKANEGGIYLLADRSIIVLCQGLEKTIQDKLVFQLRYLYMDDPLAYTDNGQENPAFCTIYDLKNSWQEFLDLCSRRMVMVTRKVTAESARAQEGKPDNTTLSATSLVTIERAISHTDLHKVIRRQPVCAVLPGAPIRRVFDELYIHIAHLRQMLKSDIDFLSNRWLFKYLTHMLDERMLELIRQSPARYLESPVSINLNVETLLSSWFDEFDAAIQPSAKVSMVLEVPVVDVFADMPAFMLARKEVQKRGYRMCLDGLTAASLASIDRGKLGLDLVKVQWNADLESDLSKRESQEMAKAVQAAGTNRVILCRCDNLAAVEYGQALGISLFQGRYIDGLLNPASKIEN